MADIDEEVVCPKCGNKEFTIRFGDWEILATCTHCGHEVIRGE